LVATEHRFTSFFVGEFEMDQGASVPLHTCPIEEGLVFTDGDVGGSFSGRLKTDDHEQSKKSSAE
jgi:hypothetical protein